MGTLSNNEKHNRSASQSDDHVDVEQVDAVAVPAVTLESFAHLDEKKILRKVCYQPHRQRQASRTTTLT